MKHLLYLLPLFLLACSPENEEVQDEQVQIAPPAEALDSIVDTEKDALRTDENEISPTLPLPQPVLQLLAEKYPGWERPELVAEAKRRAEDQVGSPALALGDYDGDTRQDVALQLKQGEEVMILAALQQQEEKYTLVELKRDILFNERGKLKSPYYLYRIAQGEQVMDMHAMNEVELPYDAIAVAMGKETSLYIFQNGSFQSYPIKGRR